jgi:hypothetical protein
VVAGTEALGRAQWRRNRGDERRHIASAQHRGSEGAQAISTIFAIPCNGTRQLHKQRVPVGDATA